MENCDESHDGGGIDVRRPKLSLRVILVVIAFFAVTFAILTRQQRVAKQLRSLGATMNYRYQYDRWEDLDRYSFDPEKSMGARVTWLGPDLADTIVSVRSTEADRPDQIARLASRLPHLRSLSIQETSLRNEDLQPILRLKKLRGLYLRGTAIDDSSVATFSQMKQLAVLNLRNTELSEEAIVALRKALPETRIHTGPYSGGFM